MAILLNDNLNIAANKPVDARYGPYATVAAAVSAIPAFQRHIGLTVGIGTSNTVDYWFKAGTGDGDLIEKSPAVIAPVTSVATKTGDVTLAIGDITNLQNTLDGKQASGTYATLVNGLVPSDQLPSYVDDVLEFADLAAIQATTGVSGKIYVAIDTGKTYRWSGTTFIEISTSEVTSVNGLTGAVTITVPTASSATPQNLGVASAGTSANFARADHVHNLPTPDDIGLGSDDSPTFNQITASQFNGNSSNGDAGILTMTGAPNGGTGGSINTNGAEYASGGSINTSGGAYGAFGGSINTSGGGIDIPGGSINTSAGGGSIDTTGTGAIGLGNAGTRTTLGGTATQDRSINLPNASGTVALMDSFSGAQAVNTGAAGTNGIDIIAVYPNAEANNIVLTFDGIKSIQNAVDAWNAARPDNPLLITGGFPEEVPVAGETITFAGGVNPTFASFIHKHTPISLPVPRIDIRETSEPIYALNPLTLTQGEALPVNTVPYVVTQDIDLSHGMPTFLECVIFNKKNKARRLQSYVAPSPWHVTLNNGVVTQNWIHPWPQNFKSRAGTHNFAGSATSLIGMDKPNHFPVSNPVPGQISIPVYKFFNGRFIVRSVRYRTYGGDGGNAAENSNLIDLFTPLTNKQNRANPSKRFPYASFFAPLRIACRYVIWNAKDQEFITGPLSRTIKFWYDPFPFNIDHVASSMVGLPVCYLNPNYVNNGSNVKMKFWLE